MQARWVLLTLVCVLLLAVGQLLFKSAALQWRVEGWSWSTLRSLLSLPLLLALVVYGTATVLWIFALRTLPLSVAFPLYALTFIIVPLLAWWFAGEPLRPNTLIGGAVIMIGVFISIR